MPITRTRKEELIAEYTDLLENSKAIIMTEYSGLNNKDLTQLRRDIRGAGGLYRVTKLTLFKRALDEADYPYDADMLSGAPVAISFCLEEIPGVAKAITDFAKDHEQVSVRGGATPATVLAEAQIKALADLPPLDVLQAQLLGLLDAPAANLVGVVQAGVAQVINVVNAYAESGGEATEE